MPQRLIQLDASPTVEVLRKLATNIGCTLDKGQPVISVDTKKKELLGNYYNKGRQWRKSKCPRKVNGHDFPDPAVPRAYPYGVYDIGRNDGLIAI